MLCTSYAIAIIIIHQKRRWSTRWHAVRISFCVRSNFWWWHSDMERFYLEIIVDYFQKLYRFYYRECSLALVIWLFWEQLWGYKKVRSSNWSINKHLRSKCLWIKCRDWARRQNNMHRPYSLPMPNLGSLRWRYQIARLISFAALINVIPCCCLHQPNIAAFHVHFKMSP